MKKPKPYDQAFKYLAEHDPQALLTLLGILKPKQQVTIKALPNEVTVSAKLPDSTYLITTAAGAQRIAHIESQTEYDRTMPRRMTEYALRLWLKYGLSVDSYLLLLTPRKVPALLPHEFRWQAGSLVVELQYQVVPLWELSAQRALAVGETGLLPFIPLMKGTPHDLVTVANKIRQIPDERQRSELDLHFVILSRLRYTEDQFLAILGSANMNPLMYEVIKGSPKFQALIREAKKEATNKVGPKERAKGRAEGRAEAVVELLLIAAQQRFPQLVLGEQLKQIQDDKALRRLFIELPTIKTEKRLLARLAELVAPEKPTPKSVKKPGTSKK